MEASAVLSDPDANSYARRQAVRDLLRDPPIDAVGLLTGAATDADRYLRQEAIQALGRLQDPAGLPILRDALADDDSYVAQEAAQAIGAFGEHEDLQRLQRLSEEGSFALASAARRALDGLRARLGPEPSPATAPAASPEAPAATVPSAAADIARAASVADLAAGSAVSAAAKAGGDRGLADPVLQDDADPVATSATEAAPAPTGTESPASGEAAVAEAAAAEEATTEDAGSAAPATIAPAASVAERVAASSTDPGPAPPVAGEASQPSEALVDEPADESEIDALLDDLTPVAPRQVDWQRARRHQALAADRLDSLRAAYQARHQAEAQLPEVLRRWLAGSERLSWERSDKDDDLAEAAESVEQAERALEADRARLRLLVGNLRRHRALRAQWWNRLLCWFSSDRERDQARREGELIAEEDQQQTRIAEAQAALEQAQGGHSALAEPLEALQADVDRLAEQQAALAAEIGAADEEIRAVLLAAVNAADAEDRIAALVAIDGDDLVLRHGLRLIREASAAEAGLAAQQDRVDERLVDCEARVTEASDALGAAIGAGFVVQSEQRDTEVRVDVDVRFEEERGFFGYSNASGTASGRGRARVDYEIDLVRWQADPALAGQIEDYREAWAAFGAVQAERDSLGRARERERESLREHLAFLQDHLARDFSEQEAGP